MDRLIRFFVERHLLVNVVTAAVIVLGIITARGTNIEGMPDVQMPKFVITAALPGASARDVETKLTIPIEDELRELDGLDSFTTVVTDNRSVTTVDLDDDTPDDELMAKERDIRNAIDSITDFPEDMPDEPTVTVFDPSKMPVLEVAISGDSAAVAAEAKRIERELRHADGVGEVSIVGLPDPELRVLVDPAAARVHGVTLLEIVRAIQRRNVSDTGGVLESAGARRQVVMWSRFKDSAEVGDVVLRYEEDGPVRVSDVARLELGRQDVGLIAGTNGSHDIRAGRRDRDRKRHVLRDEQPDEHPSGEWRDGPAARGDDRLSLPRAICSDVGLRRRAARDPGRFDRDAAGRDDDQLRFDRGFRDCARHARR
jgi:multidrug efflux pump subunit AcrB